MRIQAAFAIGTFALAVLGGACATSIVPSGTGGSSAGGAVSDGGGGGEVGHDAGHDAAPDASGPCVMASDCPSIADPCNMPACINGICAKTPKNDFGACEDGLFCTDNDTCMGGVCVGGTQKSCPGIDACHVGACDDSLKACKNVPGNDGAQCDDNDSCTGAGTCSAGACAKGPPKDCSVFNGQCTIGVCDPLVGCKPVNANEGTACDDGMANPCTSGACVQGTCMSVPANEGGLCDDNLFCTIGDHCVSGTCVSTGPNICAPPGGCYIGVCDEASNTCTSAPGNDGQPCDDFNSCTTGTTCSNGACINGQAANQGQACDDGSACTSNTICNNGSCGGGIGPTVYFADDFHDNSKGWQLDTEWQIGPAMASPPATFNPDPAQDHSLSADNGVAGVVIGGNESPVLHSFYYMTSPPFNTSGAATVWLGFYRWLNSDYDPFMHNTIDVWNGASWVNVWTSGGPPGIADAAWTFISHDLSAYKNAAMRIRFGYDITSGGVFTVGSWNIDDVLVASAACP